jgi:cytoskeletal protein CcmA (bactofilin family)
MWGSKKTEPPPVKPPEPVKPQEPVKPSVAPSPVIPEAREASRGVEEKPMNANETYRPAPAQSGATARLGPSLHVKGEISGSEDLHIDGSVEGLITLEDRKLTVGPSSKVTADVVAREIVVYGSVKGNLRARDRIEIKKDGSVVGDLTTARIMIEDGAYFKGSIEIDRGEKEVDFEKPAFARAAGSKASAD